MSEKCKDKLKILDLGVKPEAAVSRAVVLESESRSFLTFNVMKLNNSNVFEAAGTAVITLKGVIKSQFGHPNDEALGGHPLAANGLNAYQIYEVEHSSWKQLICDQNKVCFPSADWFGKKLRHFVFTFHDSTFECLAENLEVVVRKDQYSKIISELTEQI